MFPLFFLQSNKYYGVGKLSLRIMSETASTEVSYDLPIWNLIITFKKINYTIFYDRFIINEDWNDIQKAVVHLICNEEYPNKLTKARSSTLIIP
jgi:hypothetical protein